MPARDQLTALDATFLELEQADDSALMHIGSAMLFEPLPGGGHRRSRTCASICNSDWVGCPVTDRSSGRPAPADSRGPTGSPTIASRSRRTSGTRCFLRRAMSPSCWSGCRTTTHIASTAGVRCGR